MQLPKVRCWEINFLNLLLRWKTNGEPIFLYNFYYIWLHPYTYTPLRLLIMRAPTEHTTTRGATDSQPTRKRPTGIALRRPRLPRETLHPNKWYKLVTDSTEKLIGVPARSSSPLLHLTRIRPLVNIILIIQS
ncbi:hypothetical protein II1_03048 [Bacillus cereus MC118]|uniref:Uncharacterized protein n=1 Tax=Bacillus cereus MC67 TaxID=1053219 RepID=J8FR77_BACCE|nr:hypothetical protein II3_01103 [Bacillus cereus MC67]EOP13844.1 hypothetical protein II1_03048 [Bacillus cereus MC118]